MNNEKPVYPCNYLRLSSIGIIIVANQMSNREPAEKSLEFFPQFSSEECGAIIMSDNHDTVSLVRQGATWMVRPGKLSDNGVRLPLPPKTLRKKRNHRPTIRLTAPSCRLRLTSSNP